MKKVGVHFANSRCAIRYLNEKKSIDFFSDIFSVEGKITLSRMNKNVRELWLEAETCCGEPGMMLQRQRLSCRLGNEDGELRIPACKLSLIWFTGNLNEERARAMMSVSIDLNKLWVATTSLSSANLFASYLYERTLRSYYRAVLSPFPSSLFLPFATILIRIKIRS